jgi:hypothetical protein
VGEGDVTVACRDSPQTSPNHLHPNATEIYFCFSGGGVMRTPSGDVDVKLGSIGVHPRGELHECVNGPSARYSFEFGMATTCRHAIRIGLPTNHFRRSPTTSRISASTELVQHDHGFQSK